MSAWCIEIFRKDDQVGFFVMALARGGFESQLSLVAGAGLGGLRLLAIFDAALVTQVAAFLSLLLTFRGFAVEKKRK